MRNERGLSLERKMTLRLRERGAHKRFQPHWIFLYPLPPWSCSIWCTFVMHFRWDNYRLKLPNPVRIMVRSIEPPFRGNVSFANVLRAFWTCNTVSVTLKLFNCRWQSKELATHSGVSWLKKRSQWRLRPVSTACKNFSYKLNPFRVELLTQISSQFQLQADDCRH